MSNERFYPNREDEALCVSCYYARMRTDICGIYCTKGFVENGRCERFKPYRERRRKEHLNEGHHDDLHELC